MEALQGFPAGWTEVAGSQSRRAAMIGDAMNVAVMSWIFSRIGKKELRTPDGGAMKDR